MALFKKGADAQNVSPATPAQRLEAKYNSARHNLLIVIVFTLVNMVILLTNGGTYFLFSAFVPYYVTDLGMYLCKMYPDEYYVGYENSQFLDKSLIAVFIAIAAVILVMYLLSWIFSKKGRVGWLIFALVFFALDTIAMFLIAGITSDMIIDVLFHAWVIFYLASGIHAHFKLKKLPPETEEVAEDVTVYPEEVQNNALPTQEIADSVKKETILNGEEIK